MMNAYLESALTDLDPGWQPLVQDALQSMAPAYLDALSQHQDWLPGWPNLFAAMRQPLASSRYLLIGESPYPRKASANGYAFWDAAVGTIWAKTGFSSALNRATSLRNFIKMLLHARGDLLEDFSQTAIARIDKSLLVETLDDLFQNLLNKGFILLNSSLVFEPKRVNHHVKHWQPFMKTLCRSLKEELPELKLILLGRLAGQNMDRGLFDTLVAEHPYQLSFIQNPEVLSFFKPLKVLDQ